MQRITKCVTGKQWLAALNALLLGSCTPLGGDRATAPEGGPRTARVSVALQVAAQATSKTATVRAYYRTGGAAGTIVPMARAVVALEPGLQAVPVPVDLAPCLGDATGPRTTDGACPVFVAVALRDVADALVDSVTIGPLLARPGAALSPAPVTLAKATQVALTVPDTLRVGDSLAVQAVVRDSAGTVLTDRPVQWSSSDPTRATVTAEGRVRALQPGAVTLTARAFGASSSVSRTVLVDVNTVSLTLRDTVRVNDTLSVTATLRDRQGQPVSGPPVTWTSSAPAVATLDNTGRLVALAPGQVTLTAESQGRVGSLTRTVLADIAAITLRLPDTVRVNDTLTVTATPRDRRGQIVEGIPVTWRSNAPAVATINGAGRMLALAPGTVTLTAESEGQVGSITRTVLADVAAITVSLPDTVRVNDTVQVTAAATTRAGQPATNVPVSWSSSSAQVATIDASGRLIARAPGVTVLTAASNGIVGTATRAVRVDVNALTLMLRDTLRVNDTVQAAATVRDRNGAPVTGVPVAFSSQNSAVVLVSSAGQVIGLAPGTTTVTAQAEGVRKDVTISVAPQVCGSATDPENDADVAQGGRPRPDLTSALLCVSQGNLVITVRFSTGLFDPLVTRATVSLDIDRSTGTGHPGIDGGGVRDSALIGAEFIVQFQESVSVLRYAGPPINTFAAVAVLPRTVLADGWRTAIPLTMLGNSNGWLRFKVASSVSLGGNFSSQILDVMPDVGLPAAVTSPP